jgi:hypothetical protein
MKYVRTKENYIGNQIGGEPFSEEMLTMPAVWFDVVILGNTKKCWALKRDQEKINKMPQLAKK